MERRSGDMGLVPATCHQRLREHHPLHTDENGGSDSLEGMCEKVVGKDSFRKDVTPRAASGMRPSSPCSRWYMLR